MIAAGVLQKFNKFAFALNFHYLSIRQEAFRQNANKFAFALNFHYLCKKLLYDPE
jgi:hypothetical protein